MIGHQVLIGLFKRENFLIHAHFKKKKSKHDYLKSENIIFHFLEITQDNIEEFIVDINPDIIINAVGITTRREKESTINQIKFTNSLLPRYFK